METVTKLQARRIKMRRFQAKQDRMGYKSSICMGPTLFGRKVSGQRSTLEVTLA